MKLPFRTGEQQRLADLSTLNGFGTTEWSGWIRSFIFHDTTKPEIPVYDEQFSLALIDLYKDLAAPSRNRFSIGLADAFECLPLTRVNAEQISILLEVIAVVKPSESRPLVRQHLKNATLTAVSFGGMRLQTLLLGVAGKYKGDAELAACIEATPEAEQDFSWWLVGFRVLSQFDLPRAFVFLERMLPLLDSRERELMLEEEVRSLIRREKTSQALCNWFLSRREALGQNPGFTKFSQIFTEKVLPAVRRNRAQSDVYAILAEKVVNAGIREVSMIDIQELASLRDRMPENELVAAMQSIFRAAKARTSEDPWQLVDHDAPPFNRMYTKERGGITVYTSDAKSAVWLHKERDAGIVDLLQKATPDYGPFVSDRSSDQQSEDWRM